MRTIPELIRLLLSRPDLFTTGLCAWVANLYERRHLSYSERSDIAYYFIDNGIPPGRFKWPKGRIRPRLEWLSCQLPLIPIPDLEFEEGNG